MTVEELAARDYKNAKINYLRAQQRKGATPDELAHLEELVRLRKRILNAVRQSCVD